MATPIIQSVGSVSGVGIAGQGRSDLVPGETISLTDTEGANTGAAYFWSFDDFPIGTAPVILNFNTSTPTFVVDPSALLAGSYRVRCTVNGTFVSVEVLAVPLSITKTRIPSFEEEIQYDHLGNVKGWHEAQTSFMRGVDKAIGDSNALVRIVPVGGRESHNDVTPLVVGSFAFNPSSYALPNTTVAFKLSIVAANGNTPLTTHVRLRNITDSEDVTSSLINIVNTTAQAKYEATLAVGTGTGDFKSSGEKIYECRIYLDAPPGNPALDTIELYKAELRVVFTPT